MSVLPASEKPHRLLMVSHCMPQRGSGPRGRAWQLLASAARTHDVYLIAVPNALVTLDQWRAASHKTQRITLATSRDAASLRQTAHAWRRDEPFDAMLCTDAKLWRQMKDLPATLRICDGHQGGWWSRKRLAAQCDVMINRDGLDLFLDALSSQSAPQPHLLRQAA